MRKLDLLLDTLLPNRAWGARLASPNRPYSRTIYVMCRIALMIVILALVFFFGIRPHNPLG
jgi:hypothetical protein